MSDVERALRGGKLEQIRVRGDHCAVSVTAGGTATFSVDPAGHQPALRAEVTDTPVEGEQIFEDGIGRKIVRVHERGDHVSLHLDDGEIFHVLAVTYEDGCRVATREEREHGRGLSSLLDRFLGRIR